MRVKYILMYTAFPDEGKISPLRGQNVPLEDAQNRVSMPIWTGLTTCRKTTEITKQILMESKSKQDCSYQGDALNAPTAF